MAITFSTWLTGSCNGPPDAIFNMPDGGIYHQQYQYSVDSMRFSKCGLAPIALTDNCCVEILGSYETNFIYQSSTINSDHKFPRDSVGKRYCHVQPETFNTYNDIWILDDQSQDPNCVVSRFKCSNGILFDFGANAVDCNSTPTPISLNTTSIKIGGLNVKYLEIPRDDTNSEAIKWTAYLPLFAARPVPNQQPTGEFPFYISTLYMLLSVFGTLYVGGFYSYRYYKGRTTFMLACMISQLMWVTWILLDAYYIYYPFRSARPFELFNTLQNSWFGICTLLSVFISANILLAFMKQMKLRNILLAAIVLAALNFTLGGYLYFEHLIKTETPYLHFWNRLTPCWVVFMYLFDLTPPVFVFLTLTKSIPEKHFWRKLKKLHHHDRLVGMLVFLQIVNAAWFISLIYIRDYTTLLLNDRLLLTLQGIFSLTFVFHSIVRCVLDHRIRYMLSLGSILETQKKPQRTKNSLKMLETQNLYRSASGTETATTTPSAAASTPRSETLNSATIFIPKFDNNGDFASSAYSPGLLSPDSTLNSRKISKSSPIDSIKSCSLPREGIVRVSVDDLAIPYKSFSRRQTAYSTLYENSRNSLNGAL